MSAPGLEVLAVDRPDEVRARLDELVQAGALGDAPREQERARPAVGEQRSLGESIPEALAFVHVARLAECGGGATPSGQRQRAIGLQDDLRRSRAAVVGRGQCGRVRSGVADRDEIAPPERRQDVPAELVGRLADRPVDVDGPGAVDDPGAGRRRRRRGARGPGAASTTGRPSEVSATIGWRAPYSAGRMSSVMPASRTTIRPSRSRTWSTRATSQPARATRNRPGSIARRVGRRSAGSASSSSGSSRANRSGRGPTSPNAGTGNPPPTSSVSNSGRPPRSRATRASARRTASRQASTAPSCEPTWR